jgi:hypothetical protein
VHFGVLCFRPRFRTVPRGATTVFPLWKAVITHLGHARLGSLGCGKGCTKASRSVRSIGARAGQQIRVYGEEPKSCTAIVATLEVVDGKSRSRRLLKITHEVHHETSASARPGCKHGDVVACTWPRSRLPQSAIRLRLPARLHCAGGPPEALQVGARSGENARADHSLVLRFRTMTPHVRGLSNI